jgi:formylglycine-generating enzyme required for sulfatase activity
MRATSILPPPFAWVDIPAGQVTLSQAGGYLLNPATVSVAAFSIARYPITVAQYQVFIDAQDGYTNTNWWEYSKAAWLWRGENPQPRPIDYWAADRPRTHVTWYEAAAFCQWLSAQTGEHIHLPTEAEWQRAAQGDDGRVYPWGNTWDEARCKNGFGGQSIGPASVQDYEGQGDSPFGVVDMAGNVWEWCSTSWETGSNDLTDDDVRVLRGGSWFDSVISFFRTTVRQSWNPDITSDLRGFRIARAI